MSRPDPYYFAECPEVDDQGVIEAWISRGGRAVLCCDVCHTTWHDPRRLDPHGDLALGDDGSRPDRLATREQLEELGWWELVHPLSLRARGDQA